jgi:predicted ATPase
MRPSSSPSADPARRRRLELPLLNDSQEQVFERLSTFANGWTLEAAELVCAGDGVASEDVLNVRQLVRKSLVALVDVRHGRARYGLLETLREYACEKLKSRVGEVTTVHFAGLGTPRGNS